MGQNIQHLFIFLHTKQPENHLISTVPDRCMNGCRPYMQANLALKSPTFFPAAGTQAYFSPNLFSKTFRGITSFFCKICSLFNEIFAGQIKVIFRPVRTVTRLDLTNAVKPGHLMILATFRFLTKSVLINTLIKTPLLHNKTIIS